MQVLYHLHNMFYSTNVHVHAYNVAHCTCRCVHVGVFLECVEHGCTHNVSVQYCMVGHDVAYPCVYIVVLW